MTIVKPVKGWKREGFTVARRVGGGIAAASLLLAACSFDQNANAVPQRTATIDVGTLVVSVNATGNIQAEAEVQLSFDQPGTVAQVNVTAGDAVKKGDVLASLDTADLELALSQAEASLIVANANYSRTVEGPRQADLDAAQSAVNAAYANYDKVKAGPQREDYADAEAALLNAEAQLRQAQGVYDRAYNANPAGINGSPAAMQLEQATNNYNAARARYDKLSQGPNDAQLSAAWQQVESAKANLERLQQPTKQYDIDQAEAQRTQAQLQVDQARRQLDQARLIAPRDGIISVLSVKAGETVPAKPVMTLVDLSQLHIDITVDEVDVARIEPGQDVVVTLDALPDQELKGTIERIAPTSTTVNGVVSYSVRVMLAGIAAPLKAGMTANTSIVLEKRENALLVPNWAVRRDRQSGKSYLTILQDDKTSREVEVEIGLRNETSSEILSGASKGQSVLAPQTQSLLGQ
ncbi:MAG: efflux RND transporter periplasmic adaptor subunit [Chloroflexi bacterium]|nr:efflux RND transporter periplasmic adaptor subunit [Chloroflexota bacterium]